MRIKGNRSYRSEFKREAVALVINQGYGIVEAAQSMGVSKSAMSTWGKRLRQGQ